MNQVVPSFVAQYGITFAGVGAQAFLCDFERSVWLCLNCKLSFTTGPCSGDLRFLALPECADSLPYSIRYLLEAAIRNCDGFQVSKGDVEKILDWEKTAPKQVEIPFKPARVILQVR